MESISQMARRIREENALPQRQQYLVSTSAANTSDAPTDNGGLAGGIGYLGHKIGLGFLQSVEGIWDFTAGGIASIFNPAWAEQQMATDWTDYSAADEWFNPSEGWKIAGDVAGGIGTSLPGVAAATIATIATGGAATPAVLGWISAGTAGLGAAGNATKEAYLETGRLDGAAFGYGALTGALEAGVEKLTAGLFPSGSGRIINALGQESAEAVAKASAKETARTLASKGYRKVISSIWEDFRNEAIEEGLSELMSPVFKRMTYDQDAAFATPQEVGYAALVGGLSGVIMGRAGAAVDQGKNAVIGIRAMNNGTAEQILENAERLARFEQENPTGYEIFENIRDDYERLRLAEGKSGVIDGANRARLLGSLQRMTAAAPFMPFIERSAINYIINAEEIVAKYNALGMTDNNGKPIALTVEQLRAGLDMSLMKENPKEFTKQLRKALSDNAILTSLAIADATGNIMTDTRRMTEAILSSEYKPDRADLDALLSRGKQEEIDAVERALGIEDLSKVSIEDLQDRLIVYKANNGTSEFAEQAKRIREAIAAPTEGTKPLPKRVTRLSKDGLYRFKSEDGKVDMALFKDGETYHLYDYEGRNISKALTLTEVNRILKQFWASSGTVAPKVESSETSRYSAVMAEIHRTAMEKIPEYKGLSAPNQRMVRDVIRQGRAVGLSESDVMMYARVSAHSGIKVSFNKEKTAFARDKKTGEILYGDGCYSINNVEIVVNPEGKRSAASLLMHELTHAIYRTPDGKLILESEVRNLSDEEKARIHKMYGKAFGTASSDISTILMDEMNAHYAEAILSDPQILEMLLTKKPTIRERIISFLTGAKDAYSGWGKLGTAAKRLFENYKKLFDAFSERNRDSQFIESVRGRFLWESTKPKASTSAEEEDKTVVTNTDVDTDTRFALLTDEDLAEYMATGKTLHTRHRKQRMLENGKKPILTSESEIKEFISNAIQGKAGGEVRAFARVPKRLAEAISDARSTLDLEGYYLEIQADALREAYKVHSTPKMQGDIALSESDFENLHRHIFDFDGVLSVNDYNGKTEVLIYRRAENGYYQIITVSSSERKSLQITKLIGVSKEKFEEKYAKKIERNTGSPRMPEASNPSTKARHTAGALSTVIIPETEGKINPSDENSSESSSKVRHALPETDSEGVELTTQQREYFAGTQVVDANGSLLRVYHGTRRADFTQFKRNFIYFTDSREMADSYAPTGEIYSGYVKITNPFVVDAKGAKWSGIPVSTDLKKLLESYGSSTFMERGKWRTTVADIVAAVDGMVEEEEADYDGVIVLNVEDTGSYFKTEEHIVANDYIAFSSNQFKNADNKAPTSDPDTRFALPDEVDNGNNQEYNYTEEQYESFADGTTLRYSLPDDWELDEFSPIEDDGLLGDYPYGFAEEASQEGDEDLDELYIASDEELARFRAGYDEKKILEAGPPIPPGKTPNSRGEIRKIIANHTRDRVYSKKETLALIHKIMERHGRDQITAKTIDNITDSVWQGLNSCRDAEERRVFVEDMARFIVANITFKVRTEDPELDVDYFKRRLMSLQIGLGRLKFNEHDLSELRHILGKDKAYRRFLGRWGYKGKGSPYYVESFVWDTLQEGEGLGFDELDDTHYIDAMVEIDRLYEDIKERLDDKWIDAYDADDALYMVREVEEALYEAFEKGGEKSKFSRFVESKIADYRERAEFWRTEYEGIRGRDKVLGRLMAQAEKMRNLKLGTFLNATQFNSEVFKNSIETLARIRFRGNLNEKGTRGIIANLLSWYTPTNPIFKGEDGKPNSLYVESIAGMMSEFAANEHKGFSVAELETLEQIMSYFTKLVETFNKVYRQGKWMDAVPIAQKYVDLAAKNQGLKVGLFNRMFRDGILHNYMQTFEDPEALVRFMDYYERGFYTEMLEELREATIKAQIAEAEARADYDAFSKKHRTYIADATKEKLTYRGAELSRMQLMSLYMTMKREHARRGLALNGFAFHDEKGNNVRVDGLSTDNRIDKATVDALVEEQMRVIDGMLTDTDKEYIAILEQMYNGTARQMKAARDMERLGFTNVSDSYYYPIRRGNIMRTIDATDFASEMDRVSNASFNKDIVRGASQELYIESADVLFNRHLSAVCRYAYLSPAIENYDRLYNLDVSGNPNKPVSVATESVKENGWKDGNAYFRKLIADIQGISSSADKIKLLGRIRGGYAKYQLGANPKVWVTQLSSLFSASSMLDMDCILRGMTIDAKGVDDYCPIAKLRNQDNTVARSQGILDKIDGFSSILMAPIGKVDRFVICRLFGACQAQIEKNGGAKVGTDENRTAAGKLLEQVILGTQQNVFATERSSAMRSDNEFYRTITMFTADAVKVIGRVLDAFGELSTLKARLKAETDPDARQELQTRLKDVKRRCRKSLGALLLSAAFMAAIAQLFRWLYNKDQKESVVETMTVDAVGNMLGGLPLVKDAYAYLTQGYELENYAYSSINDLLSSMSSLVSTTGNIMSGKATSQEIAQGMRNLANAAGQVTGIPTRNIYNVIYGITKRISPAAAYKVFDNTFFEQNYKSDFYKAIEDGDGDMAEMLLSMLYEERIGESLSKTLHSELYSLSQKGYKVLPKSIPSSISYGGEIVELTAEMQRNMTSVYLSFKPKLESLLGRAEYKLLNDEQRAKAVNYVYDLAYSTAVEDTLGLDMGNRVLLDKLLGSDTLALFYTLRTGLESDKDNDGKTVSGSRRKKVVAMINRLGISKEEKLLLICASGYSIKDGDVRGLSSEAARKYLLKYLLKKRSLTKEEKSELATMCGFEVKNGRIIVKTAS